MIHKKVKFKDEVYWLHSSSINSSDYNLSPLDHYSDDGTLLADPFTALSYAVVYGDEYYEIWGEDWDFL